jgi:hypothetical protein
MHVWIFNFVFAELLTHLVSVTVIRQKCIKFSVSFVCVSFLRSLCAAVSQERDRNYAIMSPLLVAATTAAATTARLDIHVILF